MANDKDQNETIIIKKYANRRLYNTATSSYVTLEALARMVKDEIDFVVQDARSGEDITRSVLTQIIVEEEAKGANLLPISFLRQLISFYGDSMQNFVPHYLELSMQNFSRNQQQMRELVSATFDNMFPSSDPKATSAFDEVFRNNMDLFRRSMGLFNPDSAATKPDSSGADDEISKLREQMDVLQKQLDEIARRR